MDRELIRAHLNLYAVLQNLEDLVQLDTEMAELSRDWDISIQFLVRNGPEAFVEFKNGRCRHERGRHAGPSVKLYFASPAHLNRMFDGAANPIPLKGFTKLGFLKKDFASLTERLEHYLRPKAGQPQDETYLRINTIFMLQTGVYAAGELAMLDPVLARVASRMRNGALQIEVGTEGPYIHAVFDGGAVTVNKGRVERPMALMTLKDIRTVNDLLNGRLDAFQATVEGTIKLKGQISMVESFNLILDRVSDYLS